ncbi:MAG TPA: type III secretion system cytoplasmic ring protein SctQ [Ideonella sp.]|uniref:type III secretion system cytoplasmic ring protein SctQ n=1 Tax=Ideonella sp. TaxID=1929293 RepID=UPI002E33421B|nr:type III secretion system cytoplasmic ring protein SctQ [Ideonella sp.]HEX5687945.1 type III secretion system cytoplasmic ring protein SctQ [Ideonella sp.]
MHMPPATLLMPAWTPLGEARALPRLWPGFAHTCRTLAGRPWPIVRGGSSATLRLDAVAPAHWTEAIALRLRWHGHDGELALDAATQAWCLGPDQGEEGIPPDAPLAWRQILLADRLHGLARTLLGSVPEWEPAAAPWPRDPNTLWCSVDSDPAWPAAAGHARLRWATAEAWSAFADAVQRHAPPPVAEARPAAERRARLAACRVPLRLELGRTRLDLASLRQIAPGDIVAVDEWRPRGQALGVQLYAGRRGEAQWPAEVRQTRLTVLPATEPAMPAPAAPANPATPAAAPAIKADRVADATLPIEQLEKLEVVLHFDLGGLALNLDALEQVAAGHVLELPQPLNQCELSILCQERLLGKGQLVAVGERLGVRVTEFAVSADAAPA